MKRRIISIVLVTLLLLSISANAYAFSTPQDGYDTLQNICQNSSFLRALYDQLSRLSPSCGFDWIGSLTIPCPIAPGTPTPVPTAPASTASPKPTPTPTASPKPTPTPTASPKPTPTPTASPKPTPTVTPGAPQTVHPFETKVVELVNEQRAAQGLGALALDVQLCDIARIKSQDMRDRNYFSHTSPTYGSPFDMLRSFGVTYRSAGENIAKGYASPQAVVDAWMNSSGHRANILNPSYTKLGVGYVASGNHWTQLFLG